MDKTNASINMTHLIKVAILGAECTGKSTLAQELAQTCKSQYSCAMVPEYLRLFVDQHQRVPLAEEQISIAQEQRRLEAEAGKTLHETGAEFSILFCDTTPLLTSLYGEIVFGKADANVQAFAKNHDYDLTLVTELEFPWVQDGIMRDGPLAQTKVHYRLLARLDSWQIPYTKIQGNPAQRVKQAQDVIKRYLANLQKK